MAGPKIYLVHAAGVAMEPIQSSFRALWPEARTASLFEESLMPDLAADGRLSETMIERFLLLGR